MKMRWGILGCGGIARRRTIPGLVKAENAELVAVMDTNAAFAKEAASTKPFWSKMDCMQSSTVFTPKVGARFWEKTGDIYHPL